jgi:hypothetical protein
MQVGEVQRVSKKLFTAVNNSVVWQGCVCVSVCVSVCARVCVCVSRNPN